MVFKAWYNKRTKPLRQGDYKNQTELSKHACYLNNHGFDKKHMENSQKGFSIEYGLKRCNKNNFFSPNFQK